MEVALLDADAVIRLLERAMEQGEAALRKVLGHLALRFHSLWVAGTVKVELDGGRRRKSARVLRHARSTRKLFARVRREGIIALESCPIKVGAKEITAGGPSNLHPGEVDSVLQAKKLLSSDRHGSSIRRVTFVSGDEDAIKWATNLSLEVVPVTTLVDQLKQIGVPLR